MASPEVIVVPIAAVRVVDVDLVPHFHRPLLPVTLPRLLVVDTVWPVFGKIAAAILTILNSVLTVVGRSTFTRTRPLAHTRSFARTRPFTRTWALTNSRPFAATWTFGWQLSRPCTLARPAVLQEIGRRTAARRRTVAGCCGGASARAGAG